MISLSSSAFEDGGRIPLEYATERGGGANRSVPLSWRGVPEGTRSLALTFIDREPSAHDWIHWLVVDLPPDLSGVDAGASGSLDPPARELTNTFGTRGWGGPQPPTASGPHLYEATVYALDVETLPLRDGATFADFTHAIAGHVLGKASYSGNAER